MAPSLFSKNRQIRSRSGSGGAVPGHWLCIFALSLILGLLGCGGGKSESLYVFDGKSNTVRVWEDLDKLFEAAKEGAKIPEASRRFESELLESITLAWGGLVVDDHNSRLYLVSTQGTVFVITQPKARNGKLMHSDILSFKLGSKADRFEKGSVFGQASLDSAHDTLYVMEKAEDGSSARVWHVGKVSRTPNQARLEVSKHTFRAKGDKEGIGLAANPSGKVYALFGDGKAFDGPEDAVKGPRLRQGESRGTNGAFPANPGHNQPIQLLTGEKTLLTGPLHYGALAHDADHHELYVLAKGSTGGQTSILVFGEGQFGGSPDQAPNRTLEGAPSLRILAHASHSDWLAGAHFTPAPAGSDPAPKAHRGQGKGQGRLTLWKSPSEGNPPVEIKSLPKADEIRGLAIGE
jgi:hypothetical protein